MTLCSLMFLAVTDARGWLYRVEDMSYPEKQSFAWHTSQKVPEKVLRYFVLHQITLYVVLTCFILKM